MVTGRSTVTATVPSDWVAAVTRSRWETDTPARARAPSGSPERPLTV